MLSLGAGDGEQHRVQQTVGHAGGLEQRLDRVNARWNPATARPTRIGSAVAQFFGTSSPKTIYVPAARTNATVNDVAVVAVSERPVRPIRPRSAATRADSGAHEQSVGGDQEYDDAKEDPLGHACQLLQGPVKTSEPTDPDTTRSPADLLTGANGEPPLGRQITTAPPPASRCIRVQIDAACGYRWVLRGSWVNLSRPEAAAGEQ